MTSSGSSLTIILWLLIALQASVLLYIAIKEPIHEEAYLFDDENIIKLNQEASSSPSVFTESTSSPLKESTASRLAELDQAVDEAPIQELFESMRTFSNVNDAAALDSDDSNQAVLTRSKRFDNHKLIQVNRQVFLKLIDIFDLDETDFDIWTESGDDWIIQIRKIIYYKYLRGKCKVLLENIQDLIDTESLRLASVPRITADKYCREENLQHFFHDFHTVEETRLWYKALAQTYSSHSEFIECIGKTVEGRDIFAIKIGNKNVYGKKAIFIHGLQHAREWISGSTVNYIAYKLLSEMAPQSQPQPHKDMADRQRHGKDYLAPQPNLDASLLDLVEIIIVPIMNPDGYEYTWTSNRLWRKNRAKNQPFGRGVDLNRNWGEHWGGPGTSSNPLSDIYCGPKANSEPEVQAMEAFFIQQGCLFDTPEEKEKSGSEESNAVPLNCSGRMLGTIDFHAYSQLIMWPYGYTNEPYRFESAHEKLANDLVKTIKKFKHPSASSKMSLSNWPLSLKTVKGADYRAIPIRDLYLASGSSVDWYASPSVVSLFKGHVPYTMTFELRPLPSDPRGFILPPSEIIPTAQEIYPAFIQFVQHCMDHPLSE